MDNLRRATDLILTRLRGKTQASGRLLATHSGTELSPEERQIRRLERDTRATQRTLALLQEERDIILQREH